MKNKRKWTANEKIDNLYEIILFLLFFLLFALWKLFYKELSISFFWIWFPTSGIPGAIRRRKILKEVPILLDVLDISIEELKEAVHIPKYDLIAWEKGKMSLDIWQMYDIEDYLLKEYFFRFHQEFVLKDYLKQEQTVEGYDQHGKSEEMDQ